MESATAWVALSLYFVEQVDLADPASLSRLVSAADMINHAILLIDEVTRALDDLSARGCLDVDGSRCALSTEARGLAEAAVEESGSPMATREVRSRLGALPCFMAPAVPPLDPAIFRRGIDAYVNRMDRLSSARDGQGRGKGRRGRGD